MGSHVFELFDKAYALLDDITPRRYDCGTLCGAFCCQNLSPTDKPESGMLLLPYEKAYLQHLGATDYSYLCDSTHKQPDMLICSGHCDRHIRPFSCRIFPYYTSFITAPDGRYILNVRPDPRAIPICPLTTRKGCKRCAPRFMRNLKSAVKILSAEPAILDDFLFTANFLDSLYDFAEKMYRDRSAET